MKHLKDSQVFRNFPEATVQFRFPTFQVSAVRTHEESVSQNAIQHLKIINGSLKNSYEKNSF